MRNMMQIGGVQFALASVLRLTIWLFYGTGGLAWGNIDASASRGVLSRSDETACASVRGSESDTNIGWTIGAGME